MKITTRRALAAALLPAALFLAACGSDSDDSSSSNTTAASQATDSGGSDMSTTAPDDMSTETTMKGDMAEPTGDGCAAVPKEGAGSFSGMADDPVATAASNNPALKTLVAAVKQADLVDTLNGGEAFTVFAPADSAFAKIPKADLDKVLADKDQLTSILTYHVIPERIEPADLGGTYETVNGAELTVSGSAPGFSIDDGKATVVCSGVQTANATVYIIDSVLMPPAS